MGAYRPGAKLKGKRSMMRKPDEHGQFLVEFALILPAFLLLMMGIVEFGRLMFTCSSND